MFQEVTVRKAIARGHVMVNVPVMMAIVGLPVVTFYLTVNADLPKWSIGVAFFFGMGMAWLIWSYMITKWRIWAFSRVKNVHELKEKAIEGNLIWPDGSIFEKTEIRTRKDRITLEKLNRKFLKEDVYEQDFLLPPTTVIYNDKGARYVELVIMAVVMGVGIVAAMGHTVKGYVMGGAMILLALYQLKKIIRRLRDRGPQITINDQGIKLHAGKFYDWWDISGERVIKESSAKNTKYYLVFYGPVGTKEQIELEPLNVTPDELRNMLRTYRLRNNSNCSRSFTS